MKQPIRYSTGKVEESQADYRADCSELSPVERRQRHHTKLYQATRLRRLLASQASFNDHIDKGRLVDTSA